VANHAIQAEGSVQLRKRIICQRQRGQMDFNLTKLDKHASKTFFKILSYNRIILDVTEVVPGLCLQLLIKINLFS